MMGEVVFHFPTDQGRFLERGSVPGDVCVCVHNVREVTLGERRYLVPKTSLHLTNIRGPFWQG